MGAAQIRSRPKNLRPNFQNANFQNALTRLRPGRRLIVPIAVRAGGGSGRVAGAIGGRHVSRLGRGGSDLFKRLLAVDEVPECGMCAGARLHKWKY